MEDYSEFLKTLYGGHLGKVLLEEMKLNEKLTHQIDMVTGVSETNGSVRNRIIQLAQVLKAKNLKMGDQIMIGAMNHNDAGIPFLSSMCLGLIPVNLAVGMTKTEINHVVSLARPKIIFTDPEMVDDINAVFTELKIEAEIVVFGPVDEDSKYISFTEFSKSTEDVDNFICEEFNPETTTAFAVCSSGTTGLPKLVAITHKTAVLLILIPMMRMPPPVIRDKKYPYGKMMSFSPMYWISGIYSVLGSAITGYTRIQTKESYSNKIACDAIEKYNPNSTLLSPMAIFELAKDPNTKQKDLSGLNLVFAGGSLISQKLIDDFQKLLPNGKIIVAYGSTEAGSVTANLDPTDGSIGKMSPWVDWKIVDPETEKALGPNETGELRLKTIMMFQKYYNDPESTANAFDKDNYYKTGDLLYHDEEGNFFFVDRCKEVIKHRNYQISTAELENKINSLPEVFSACVVGLPDPADGELPMAFVQLISGATITEQKIKDVIKESLSDYKQLRGGVVFLDKMPETHSGKINRKAVNTLKLTMKGK